MYKHALILLLFGHTLAQNVRSSLVMLSCDRKVLVYLNIVYLNIDINCRNLWSPLAKAFIDVRIFNPQAESNWNKSVQQMYNSHEEEKKKEYGPRVL